MRFNLKKYLTILGIVLLAIWAFQEMNLPSLSMPTTFNQLEIENSIKQNRTGDLVIKVVNSRQEPIAGAAIQLKQTRHHFEFGTALSTKLFTSNVDLELQKKYLETAKQLFNASVHENALKWYATEPVRGQVSYADADRILNWSQINRLKMRGHTLFWEVEKWNTDWLKTLNQEELFLAVQKRTVEVCSRYQGKIGEYDVLNEMLHGDFFRKRLGEDIVEKMFRWCHTADPNARLYVNDYDILNGAKLDSYVQQIRYLLKRGVPIGGIGVQGHIRGSISAARVQQSLDTLAQFNLPIKITEFDVVAPTEAEKTQILTDVYRVAFAHPAVKGILMWGFWEGAHWEPKAALYSRNWQPLPIAKAYLDLLYNKWWTKLDGLTNQVGVLPVRAFFGEYILQVDTGNKVSSLCFTLSPEEKTPKEIVIVVQPR